MSITKNQALTDAQTEHDSIVAAANAAFIAEADAMIQEAIDQGRFFINCTSNGDIDPKEIFQYYSDLGYAVAFPDYTRNLAWQPASLFGQAWEAYWAGTIVPDTFTKPVRFLISWKP